jgi:hypothetical protein
LWVDDELDITQADMTLTGYNHASLTGTNESQFDIVTEGWNENYLTWDNSPTTSTSTTENVPNKTTATANSVVDVLDFWNVWQANNTANYGMKFKLQTTTNSYRQQYYQSSSSTTASSRPKIEFKVDLTTSYGCSESEQGIFAHLKYELDGYYHIMKNGKIKFIFDQEYDTDDLKFKMFNHKDILHRTDADFPIQSTTNGDNYVTIDVSDVTNCIGKGFFYLEVTNSKKEKSYLRFFNDHSIPECIDYTADPNQNEDQ